MICVIVGVHHRDIQIRARAQSADTAMQAKSSALVFMVSSICYPYLPHPALPVNRFFAMLTIAIAGTEMAYGDDAAMIAYLASTGRTLPGDAVPDVLRDTGGLYVDQFEHKFRGRALTDLASFPRDLWPVVPTRVEWAAYEAAWAVSQGVDIFGAGGTAGGQVIREKVDVLEVQYAGPQDGMGYWEANMFILPRAYALLLPFFKRTNTYASAFIV